jgi:8-oxo-dGTP pyrophosphatase MutT (NUDIX family)
MNHILNFEAFESQSFQNRSGETFWGDRGAGVLPICPSTGRLLVAYRSADVNEPHTWGIFGGMIDHEEEPHEAARREMEEESGFSGKFKIIPAHVYRSPKGGFTYFNFIGIVDQEFQAEFDWETEDAKWMTLDELVKLNPKHFGLAELLKHSMKEIQDALQVNEKLEFHHSDAPDAKGRFRDLSIKKLAKWLVRTRKGDMRKITGSLNQQVNFNKKKDPAYAEKMEKTRTEVKKILKIEENLSESVDKPYEIKSEKFWRGILFGNKKALEILDTVMKRQGGFASHAQMEVLNRAKRGDKSPYHTKN